MRIALITGGSSGIGRACAERLRADGYAIAIADVDARRGAEVAAELGSLFIQADLSLRAECKRVVAQTIQHLGGLDILLNNAGFQHVAPLPDFDEDIWDKMLSLMLSAPFLLTKYAWEHLKVSGQGRIIHMGSVHSLTASPYKAAYVTAKHGLLGLMRTSALEGGEFGITCNTVCPAYVRTPLVEKQIAAQAQMRGIGADEVEEQVFLAGVAVKRMLEPRDVAAYVSFLASEAAWGVTGSEAKIDLGWTAS